MCCKQMWKKTIPCPGCKLPCNGSRGLQTHIRMGTCSDFKTCSSIPICEPTPAECGQMNFAGTSEIFNDYYMTTEYNYLQGKLSQGY